MAYSDVALLVALTVSVALAYPAKEDESYYNRLHEFQDSYGKDVRNLDGIDTREEPRPLFNYLTKTNQGENSEKGPQTKFDFRSSSHLDGIGGGHLVRDFDLEQGLGASMLDVMLPDYVNVGKPLTFGVVRKYPKALGSDNVLVSDEALKELFRTSDSTRCNHGSNYESLLKSFAKNNLGVFNYEKLPSPLVLKRMDIQGGRYSLNGKRSLDSIGGGHLLYSKRDSDFFEEGNLLKYKKDLDSIGGGHLLNYKKDLDGIGGGHLLNNKKDLDGIGGGHLLNYKKDLDGFGGGHLLNYKKDLDSIGGGHLLSYKKDLDGIGGGNLLNYKKDLDGIGGGHLLNYKKDLDGIGRGHLLIYKKDLDGIRGGHILNYKKDLDGIGGGHLLNYKKDLDGIGGGHLLNYKKDLDGIGGGNLLEYKKKSLGSGYLLRYLDFLGGQNFPNGNNDFDQITEDNFKRESNRMPSYSTHQKYYSGAGLPLKFSRPLCTSSRWFQNVLNNYLVREELKKNNKKGSESFKTDELNGLYRHSKAKNIKYSTQTPRGLDVEAKQDFTNVGVKGLSEGFPETPLDEDQNEPPFGGIIELSKLYIPYSLTQTDK